MIESFPCTLSARQEGRVHVLTARLADGQTIREVSVRVKAADIPKLLNKAELESELTIERADQP